MPAFEYPGGIYNIRKANEMGVFNVRYVSENERVAGVQANMRYLAGTDGTNFDPDANGPTADRADYDTQAQGFSFLDTTVNLLYFKQSATSGDWSAGVEFGQGDDGWTPIYALITDGERRVLKVVDWTGGDGVKPTINVYVGATGFEALIANGVDIRGATGVTGATGGDYYDVVVWVQDQLANGEKILRHEFARAVDFPTNLTASRASSLVASTGAAVIDLQKNGVSFGTITFTGSTTGVFSATATSFAAGDVLTAVGPAPANSTLADLSITLAGTRP